MGEIVKIILPQDEEIRKALEDKLKEYKIRFEKFKSKNPYIHPELINTYSTSGYKIKVVEKLLKDGELDISDFALELEKRDNFFVSSSYENAIVVINDYIKTGGKNVCGGTGFSLGKEKRIFWQKRLNMN